MPDISASMKRPLVSSFGEGSVKKRPCNDTQDKPKNSDSRTSITKAILSGPNGFRVKPASSSSSIQKPSRPHGLPSNQIEALAAFKPTASHTPVRSKPLNSMQAALGHPSDDNPFLDPQSKMRLGSRLQTPGTPLTSRVRPPDLLRKTPKLTTPSRKVLPFHLLRVPVAVLTESTVESSATPLKKPSIPKFDLGGKGKGKMMTMTALEPPIVELLEEKEVSGETLELQRGLLVSPVKSDRRKGRFIRNGLAERAKMLIDRSSIALTLWRKEAESRSGRLQADLTLHVANVVHISRNANAQSRSAGALRSILAVCAFPDGEECNVLFSFKPDVRDSHALDSNEAIKEGAVVLVWRPWQETKHPPTLFCSRFIVLSASS